MASVSLYEKKTRRNCGGNLRGETKENVSPVCECAGPENWRKSETGGQFNRERKKNEKPRLENILHCLQRDRWNSTRREPLPGQEVPSGARRHVVWCHDLERKNAYNLYYFAAVSKSCAERSFHTAGTSLTGKAGKARIEGGGGGGENPQQEKQLRQLKLPCCCC